MSHPHGLSTDLPQTDLDKLRDSILKSIPERGQAHDSGERCILTHLFSHCKENPGETFLTGEKLWKECWKHEVRGLEGEYPRLWVCKQSPGHGLSSPESD